MLIESIVWAAVQQTQVEVRWYESKAELVEYCHKLGAWDAPKPVVMRQSAPGCAEVREGHCRIHSLRPRAVDDDRTLTLGHELLHCFWGRYHG